MDEDLGHEAYECWQKFAEASRVEADVIDRLENAMLSRLETV